MAVLVAVVVCVRVRECRRWMDVSEDRERDVEKGVC